MGDYFGVDQGAIVNSMGTTEPASETAPSLESNTESLETSKASTPETTKEEILDLDKLERFRFDGKEWNPKDLKNSYLMREDYTRKTQEVAEARKYADNFKYDVQALVKQPSLMDKFASIYPKEYVQAAKEILSLAKSQQVAPSPNNQTPAPQIDPNFVKEIDEIKGWIQEQNQQRQQQLQEQASTWLDNQYEALGKKYPNAAKVEEIVTARADYLMNQGHKVDEKVLDKLFSDLEKEVTDRFLVPQQNKVKEQLKTGLRGKDVGKGGVPASEGPRQYKSFKEATAAALSDLRAK